MNSKVLPILVFQTDFTYLEGAVASMYGVVRSVSRDVEIITATHDLPQYDIWSASYRLQQYMEFWPKGTVFVSVVDPGVGTQRKACVALTKDGYYVVTPDNGTLTHIKQAHGIQKIREIDETMNRLSSTRGTSVFHGRDLFGYCGARLAAGIITYEQVGKEYDPDEIVELAVTLPHVEENRIEGIIEIDDPNFGNAWTNIPLDEMKKAGFVYGEDIHVVIEKAGEIVYDKDTKFARTFGDVQKGEPVLYNNEQMHVSFALSQGNFMKTYGITFGPDHKVILEKKHEE